eukprot:13516422-Alexandrium_andersonii.AAC.1
MSKAGSDILSARMMITSAASNTRYGKEMAASLQEDVDRADQFLNEVRDMVVRNNVANINDKVAAVNKFIREELMENMKASQRLMGGRQASAKAKAKAKAKA